MMHDYHSSDVYANNSEGQANAASLWSDHADARTYWWKMLRTISEPVLSALAARRLKETMPVESRGGGRERFTYLEAIGRTLAGIAPWLESGSSEGAEGRERQRLTKLAVHALDAATDPASPDRVNFDDDYQPIVDAAFLAHAIIRAPRVLGAQLDERIQRNVIQCLKETRSRKPVFSNWLLFSAMTECALYQFGEQWDPMRVDYAVRQHEQWYVGDGTYGDGPSFHWDYYNSYVIQPMLVDILKTVGHVHGEWKRLKEPVIQAATRYAAVQERLIAPDGTFPPLGRSLTYRCGAFQHLAQMALQHHLPETVAPGQVRSALTAVIQRSMEAPETFDEHGWLTVGFCGHQPELGEGYISTGSLYLCTTAFVPLGLATDDPFWTEEAQDWTSKKVWSGQSVLADHAADGLF